MQLAKRNGLEKLACGKSRWVPGLQGQRAEWAWAQMAAQLLGGCTLIPAALLSSCPGAVFSITRDSWGLLTVIAGTSWASLLASVSSMERGAVGKIECDGA